jgi:four helix bundle protein
MATVTKFEELDVWQLTREIVNDVYDMANRGNFNKDYALRDQIRRSAISILSNIAEGFESGSDKQFARYLKIAKGSAGECRAQLYVALDQRYISQNEFSNLKAQLIQCSKKSSSLISYLNSSKNQVKELEIIYNTG